MLGPIGQEKVSGRQLKADQLLSLLLICNVKVFKCTLIQKFSILTWDSWGLSLYIVFYRGVYSYFDQILYFEGRTSHPSLVSLLLLIQYSSFLINKKKVYLDLGKDVGRIFLLKLEVWTRINHFIFLDIYKFHLIPKLLRNSNFVSGPTIQGTVSCSWLKFLSFN